MASASANLTIRDFYFHPIIFNGGTERPFVHNAHLIDAGQQFIKSNPDAAGIGASDGVMEILNLKLHTHTTTIPRRWIVQGGANWVIRHNLLRNLQAPGGRFIGPAVLVWRGSSNTRAEGNTLVNCGRGIMYGAETRQDSHIAAESSGITSSIAPVQAGDVGIQVADSPGTEVLNNTVLLSGTYGAAIEYRYQDTTGLLIANNLIDSAILARDGAAATLTGNLTEATAEMFVNAAAGDLHLNPSALSAINQGTAVAEVVTDWDGESRPMGKKNRHWR